MTTNKVVNVPQRKKCLDGKTAQSVMIAAARLPPPPVILEAINSLDDKVMSPDNIGLLIRIWPSPEDISNLKEEDSNKAEDDKWDKGEEFILGLLVMNCAK